MPSPPPLRDRAPRICRQPEGHQRASESHQRVIRGPSEGIQGHPRASEGIRGHPRASEGIRGHPRASEGIRGHQKYRACRRRRPADESIASCRVSSSWKKSHVLSASEVLCTSRATLAKRATSTTSRPAMLARYTSYQRHAIRRHAIRRPSDAIKVNQDAI